MAEQFNDWQVYYATYDFTSLVAEAAAFKDILQVSQCCAYLDRLIELACDDPGMSQAKRTQAVSLAGTVEDMIRKFLSSQDPEALDRFERAIVATFDYVRKYCLYPQIAELIASGQFTTTRNPKTPRPNPLSATAIPQPLARNPVAEALMRAPLPPEKLLDRGSMNGATRKPGEALQQVLSTMGPSERMPFLAHLEERAKRERNLEMLREAKAYRKLMEASQTSTKPPPV